MYSSSFPSEIIPNFRFGHSYVIIASGVVYNLRVYTLFMQRLFSIIIHVRLNILGLSDVRPHSSIKLLNSDNRTTEIGSKTIRGKMQRKHFRLNARETHLL